MSEEQLKALQEYNLEYLEARNSEEIFGGDYTSAVELKYAELKIEEMRKELINQDKYIAKLKEEYANQLQQKENIIKELNDKIEDDKMIIEGNWGCIDNLKKDYNLQKNKIKEAREYIENKVMCSNEIIDGLKKIEVKELLEILDKEVISNEKAS